LTLQEIADIQVKMKHLSDENFDLVRKISELNDPDNEEDSDLNSSQKKPKSPKKNELGPDAEFSGRNSIERYLIFNMISK
jgi:hypothetical protein